MSFSTVDRVFLFNWTLGYDAHRLLCLNAWSLAGSAVWEGSGMFRRMGLMERSSSVGIHLEVREYGLTSGPPSVLGLLEQCD